MSTTMINPITLVGDEGRFLSIIGQITEFMSIQEGFVQLRFFRSHQHTDRFYMLAEWDSLEEHQRAADARTPEVLAWFEELKNLTVVAPDFFETLEQRAAAAAAS